MLEIRKDVRIVVPFEHKEKNRVIEGVEANNANFSDIRNQLEQCTATHGSQHVDYHKYYFLQSIRTKGFDTLLSLDYFDSVEISLNLKSQIGNVTKPKERVDSCCEVKGTQPAEVVKEDK